MRPKGFQTFQMLRPKPKPPVPKASALPTAQHPAMISAVSRRAADFPLYYTYFFASVKCSNFFDDFFLPMEYNTLIKPKYGRDAL